MHLLISAGAAGAAYLIGSIPFAVIVSRAMGLADPRTYGSGNPGATNVLRSGSRLAAGLTLLGDALKGWAAVWLAQRLGPSYGLGETATALAAIAVFLGHLYPLFLRFKGGKGVATAAGVILALDPWLGLAAVLTWISVAIVSRYSSAASMAAAVLTPVYAGIAGRFGVAEWALVFIAVMTVLRHRANLQNLRAGTERRLGAKTASPPPATSAGAPKS